MKKLLAILLLQALAPSAAAALDDQSVLWVSWIKPKPGMEAEFEAGIRAHHRWRADQGDTWAWLVWRIDTGAATGTYAIGTFNHAWSDFDTPPVDLALARENRRQTIMPYVDSIRVEHYVYQAAISNVPDDLPPRNFSITEMIEVRVGKERDFMSAVSGITDAIKQVGWPNYYEWYRLDYGGRQPTYARVRLLWSWDDLANPEKSLRDVLEQVYGEREAAKIADMFNAAVERRENRTAILRKELFYVPAGPSTAGLPASVTGPGP